MTFNTAKIEARNGQVVVSFMRSGNFTVGEQTFGDSREGRDAAFQFCRERGLRVI